MVGQDMKEQQPEKQPRKEVGLRLAEDDLNVGDYVCVLSLKQQPKQGAPIMGQSMQIKAVCLPYFVGQMLSDPDEPTLTLDCRFLNLMRVDEAFVKAQQEGAKRQQAAAMGGMMVVSPPPRRKKSQEGG
ncbi:hypothetical protein [Nitrospira sp. BLG_2]|uniref:hypothetical protein n=1 Tax=Nitrospira sp. BLG_2 TaxID=3397507 RepID=UPI003B9AE1A3